MLRDATLKFVIARLCRREAGGAGPATTRSIGKQQLKSEMSEPTAKVPIGVPDAPIIPLAGPYLLVVKHHET